MRYLFLILAVLSLPAQALEKDYNIPWCKSQNGLWEGSAITIRDQYTGKVEGYVDCLTATHAIETDFDYKWKESVTQALWYANNTGKRAGILLIIKPGSSGEKKLRDLVDSRGLPIDIWTVPK